MQPGHIEHAAKGQHTAGHRIYEQLERRLRPARPAPDPHDQKQRHQGKLKEHVKDQQVHAQKDPAHPRLQQQHQAVIGPRTFADPAETTQYRQRRQKIGQQNQPQTDPVHPQVKTAAQLRQKFRVKLLRKTRSHPALDELHQHHQRRQKRHATEYQRQLGHTAALLRPHQRNPQRTCHRQQNQQRQHITTIY